MPRKQYVAIRLGFWNFQTFPVVATKFLFVTFYKYKQIEADSFRFCHWSNNPRRIRFRTLIWKIASIFHFSNLNLNFSARDLPSPSASIRLLLLLYGRPWRLRLTGSALSWSFPPRRLVFTMIRRRPSLCFRGCWVIRLGLFTTNCAAVPVPWSPKRRGDGSLSVENSGMLLRKPFLLLGWASLSFDLLGNVEMDSLCLSLLYTFTHAYVDYFEAWMFCLRGEIVSELDCEDLTRCQLFFL